MIISRILTNRKIYATLCWIIIQHGRFHIGKNLRARAQLSQMSYVYKILSCNSSIDLRHLKSIAHQRKCQLKRISVHALPYCKGGIRTNFSELFHRPGSLILILLLVKSHPKDLSQSPILIFDLIHLIEPSKLNKRDLQPVMKILCRKPCFRMKHQIEISLGHGPVFLIILTSGNLMDGFYTSLM